MKRKHGKPPDGTEALMIGYMVSAVVIAIVF